MVNILNEPFWADPPNNPVNVGWIETPYSKNLGADYLIETYMAFYNSAVNKKMTPGENVRLIISVDGIFFPSKKLTKTISEIQRAKQEIGIRLGIPTNEVQLDLAIQFRLDHYVNSGQTSNEGRYRIPSFAEFEEALSLVNKAGISFHITEFEIANLNSHEFNRLLHEFSLIANRMNAESIIYGGLSHTKNNPFLDVSHPLHSFDKPIATYYAYLQYLYEVLRFSLV